jgi:DASS family divalent anion:Na+ symporter
MANFSKLLISVLFGFVVYNLPNPEGLSLQAWHMFAIFISTILGIVLKPFPTGAIALIGMFFASITNTINFDKEALAGFASPVSWLILFVFFIARGFIKSKLGYRIAYHFLAILGKTSLGIGYGLILAEFIIAPMIPSNTARAGGIIYPILKAISEALGSRVEDGTARKLGSYLTKVAYQGNLIVSAMFLTAMAANPMIQCFAAKQGIQITWGSWALAASVPGILSMLIVPFVIYLVYPPEIKKLPEAVGIAKQKLKELGAMTWQEIVMSLVFSGMVVLWIFGDCVGISAATTAMIGLVIILVVDIINWDDILKETEAWHTFIWFSILVMMSNFLEKFGFVSWLGGNISIFVHGMDWKYAFLTCVLIYFYSHYFFAGNTAHVGAMYGAFLSVMITCGAPPVLSALVLGFFSNLFSSTTHYGTGAAAMYYGSGYVTISSWWYVGFIVSVTNLLIWLGLGGVWWKFLNLW